ncbi:MAG TPA: hypothetical protein VK530_07765 [Candidatus Acidoferrum sp.]|nr:hypothetical protein [Candidatus Acidoferrum sp.]
MNKHAEQTDDIHTLAHCDAASFGFIDEQQIGGEFFHEDDGFGFGFYQIDVGAQALRFGLPRFINEILPLARVAPEKQASSSFALGNSCRNQTAPTAAYAFSRLAHP